MHLATFVWTIALSAGAFLTGYAYVVTVSSHLHSLLPPWDNPALDAFPTFQKYYRLIIYFLGYLGASYRSAVHPQISTANGTKLSDNAVAQNGK